MAFRSLAGNKVPHLAPDQVLNVGHPDSRGNRWSDKTVQKALQVRLACGTRGYELLKDEVLPLPSERTLQRRIEDVKFEPGVYAGVPVFICCQHVFYDKHTTRLPLLCFKESSTSFFQP